MSLRALRTINGQADVSVPPCHVALAMSIDQAPAPPRTRAAFFSVARGDRAQRGTVVPLVPRASVCAALLLDKSQPEDMIITAPRRQARTPSVSPRDARLGARLWSRMELKGSSAVEMKRALEPIGGR